MLRFHFTSEDLTRVTVATEPHAIWEIAVSLHRLQTREGRWALRPGSAPHVTRCAWPGSNGR